MVPYSVPIFISLGLGWKVILEALQLLFHSLVYRLCEDLDCVFVLVSEVQAFIC